MHMYSDVWRAHVYTDGPRPRPRGGPGAVGQLEMMRRWRGGEGARRGQGREGTSKCLGQNFEWDYGKQTVFMTCDRAIA